MSGELSLAAEQLIKWDKRRAKVARILHFEIANWHPEPDEPKAFVGGDPRLIPALLVGQLTEAASEMFCDSVASIGARKLSPEDPVPPHLCATGYPLDPFVQFKNGLILRSVAAAEYVLDNCVERQKNE